MGNKQAPDHLHPTVRAYVESAQIARTYDACFAEVPLFQYDCLFLDEYLAPPGRVLDVGCGTGRHLGHLAQRGFITVGLDLSQPMLAEARANLEASSMPYRLIRADFHALPLNPAARFDGILLMFSTLGLIRSSQLRQELLASLQAHLLPGGCLLAHVHNYHYATKSLEGWRDRLRRLAGLAEPGDQVMREYRGIQNLFLHSFTREEVISLLSAAGYRPLEIRPLNDRRDGVCRHSDPANNANGFLIAATRK